MIYDDERLAIFVDGHNFYATAKRLDIEVDYKRLLTHFTSQGQLLRASYYCAILESDEFVPLRPLVDWLQYNGWNVVEKAALEFVNDDNSRKVKGNTSVDLTVDAIALAPHVDHVVLMSGDRDFSPLVKHLQSMGKRVSVVSSIKSSPKMISDELRRQADTFIDLLDLRADICRQLRAAS